ncbi:MAG: hypothetical protein ACYDGM_14255 [Vulcanimicrobiaceae bacterium]
MTSAQRTAIALIFVLALAACGSSGVAGPAGWQKSGPATWKSASGERYTYASRNFGGTLSDLASQLVIGVELSNSGARLLRSDPIATCPAQAGIATFVQGATTIQQAFAVIDNHAITIAYERPSSTPPSPAVAAAMQHTLCVAPL